MTSSRASKLCSLNFFRHCESRSLICSYNQYGILSDTGTRHQLHDNSSLQCLRIEASFLREYICPKSLNVSICWLLPCDKSPKKVIETGHERQGEVALDVNREVTKMNITLFAPHVGTGMGTGAWFYEGWELKWWEQCRPKSGSIEQK